MTRLLIYLFFTLSGAVALTYESLWSRYLKLFLGHSSYGQMVTLIMFMGGLGLGSFLAARYLRRVRNPFLVYARIELVAAILGFTFHAFYLFLTGWFFHQVAAIRDLSPVLADVVQIGICVLLTLPFATLLGTTFPLIASGMIRYFADGGKRSLPLLYFANSLGGAVGILFCSYWLVSAFGTMGALQIASLGNLAIAAGFYWIHRRGGFEAGSVAADAVPGAEERAVPEKVATPALQQPSRVHLWLFVATGTGLASFIYEIGWIRLLSLILGSSTHSFDAMISAFILGLAFGGLFARRLIKRFTGDLAPVLGVIQVIMGTFAVLSLYLYRPFFEAVQTSHALFAKTEAAFPLHAVFKYLLCLALMFPSAFCAGMTLPIITWRLIRDTGKEAFTGWVYGWNTIGSITGAALAGLVLMPLLQLKWTIFAGAALDILLGLVLLSLGVFSWKKVRPALPQVALRVGAVALVAAALLPAFWTNFDPAVICSGQFRKGAGLASSVVEVRHGKTATISVGGTGPNRFIATNGKSDGSIRVMELDEPLEGGDEATVLSLAVLPMLTRTDEYDAAVIGMGTGMTGHYLLGDDRLRSLDLIEIEQAVIDLSPHFRPRNERLFTDERLHIIVEDAKRHFYTNRKQYDVIVSEPSNPWVSGVSGLFTKEFYTHLQHFMKPGGVLVQWVHGYEFRDDLLVSILAALRTFEHFEIYRVPENEGDFIVIAGNEPFDFISGAELEGRSQLHGDLARFGRTIDHFGPRNFIASSKTLAPLLDDFAALTNSDFFPYVEQHAETAFFTSNRVHLPNTLTDSFVGYADIMEKERIDRAREIRSRTAVPQKERSDTERKLRDFLRSADADSDWLHIEQLLLTATVHESGSPEWLEQDWVKETERLVAEERLAVPVRNRFALLRALAAADREGVAGALPAVLETIEPEVMQHPYWIRTLFAASIGAGDLESMDYVIAEGVGKCGKLSPDERLLLHHIAAQSRIDLGAPSIARIEGEEADAP